MEFLWLQKWHREGQRQGNCCHPLQLTGQNVVVNTGATRGILAQQVSSFISQTIHPYRPKRFLPCNPMFELVNPGCSQDVSKYPCRMTQGWATSHEHLKKTAAAVVLSPSPSFSHTSLTSVTNNDSSSLFSGGEFTQAL